MKVDVVIPEMGESIAEGTIAKWLKKPGDSVRKDEAIVEITTDKIDSEIPSVANGVLSEILVPEGETVAVGTCIGRIEKLAAGQSEAAVTSQKVESIPEPKAEESPVVTLSPVARNIAQREGVSDRELRSISGTGRAGKLTKGDLLEYLESRPGETEPLAEESSSRPAEEPRTTMAGSDRVEVIEMSAKRKVIAERMVESKRISPHTYTVAEVDMTKIVKFRESVKAKFEREKGFKLTYTPFILQATALALKKYPLVNSSVEGEKILRKDFVNLGFAVALEGGLIVPVIKGADEKNFMGIARSAYDLASRASNKTLTPADVQEGTFTVTNPGIWGNIFGLPIINQPQLGILGVGAIKKRPVVTDEDAIAIRSIMYLSFSYDHRVIDGALAAQFVQEIKSILESFDLEHVF